MPDQQIEMQRRGFWLRMAREHAGFSQATAAKELGLSARSKSTLSAWEAGTREPRPSILSRMAALYGVPIERLMTPPPTAFEEIDGWLRQSVRAASELEQLDWAEGQGRGPSAASAPSAEPGRRSA
jgi:transcriptional regulator with XRE-family HTH domain